MKFKVISIVFVLVISSLMVCNYKASADVTYWATMGPPAYNGTTWAVYPRYATSEVTTNSIKVYGDSSTYDMYVSTTGVYQWAKTNHFNDTASWVDPGSGGYYTMVGSLPPANATIISVYVWAAFQSSVNRPDMQLYYSIDDESSWNYSSILYASVENSHFWNVTSLENWTGALIGDVNTSVKMKAYCTPGVHYYLDYLGFFVVWSAELPGGGSGVDEPTTPAGETPGSPFNPDYDIIFTAEGIFSIFGIVGLLGMIAALPMTVYLFKTSESDKFGIAIKMLAMFMVFMTFFMVSIGF